VVGAAAVIIPLIVSPITADAYFLPKLLAARAAVAGLLVIVAIAAATGRLHLRRTPLDIPLALFVASALISTVFASNKNLAVFGSYGRFEGLLTIALYALLFWLAVQSLASARSAILVLRLLLGAAFVVALVSIVQVVVASTSGSMPAETGVSFGGFLRGYGTFGSPNALGAFLAMVLPLAVWEVLAATSSSDRLVGANLVVVLSIALVLTFSRTAWFAGAVAVLAVFVAAVPARRRVVVVALCVLAGAAIVGSAQLIRSPNAPSVVRATQGRLLSLDAPASTSSGQFRLHVWLDTLRLIESRPLFGYGPDSFGLVYPRFQSGNWSPGYIIDRAHSELLDVAAAQGLVGLATYLMLLIAVARAFWRSRHQLQSLALIAGGAAYVACTAINFSYLPSALMFWIYLAAAVTIWSPPEWRPVIGFRPTVRRLWGLVAAVTAALSLAVLVVAPYLADLSYRQAIDAAQRGRVHEARTSVQVARALAPWQTTYAVLAGTLALRPGPGGQPSAGADLPAARRAFLDAINLGTSSAAAYRYLAEADAGLGLREQAMAAARAAVELNRFDPENQAELNRLTASPG